jgi:uncharacterized OsmC-like protein
MTHVQVSIDKGLRATAKTDTHTWYSDESIEDGGTATAPDPVQQVLGAVGLCMATTVRLYADRKQWPLERIEIDLTMEKFSAADYPAYQGEATFVHEIREQLTFIGDALTDEQRARLLDISTKCPVRRIITNPVFFVHGAETPTT